MDDTKPDRLAEVPAFPIHVGDLQMQRDVLVRLLEAEQRPVILEPNESDALEGLYAMLEHMLEGVERGEQ